MSNIPRSKRKGVMMEEISIPSARKQLAHALQVDNEKVLDFLYLNNFQNKKETVCADDINSFFGTNCYIEDGIVFQNKRPKASVGVKSPKHNVLPCPKTPTLSSDSSSDDDVEEEEDDNEECANPVRDQSSTDVKDNVSRELMAIHEQLQNIQSMSDKCSRIDDDKSQSNVTLPKQLEKDLNKLSDVINRTQTTLQNSATKTMQTLLDSCKRLERMHVQLERLFGLCAKIQTKYA